jgi:hypothetical protein
VRVRVVALLNSIILYSRGDVLSSVCKGFTENTDYFLFPKLTDTNCDTNQWKRDYYTKSSKDLDIIIMVFFVIENITLSAHHNFLLKY